MDEGVYSQSGLGERHHPACPRKSITHHRDQWPTFTRSPKCSSPLLNFSSSLHLCEDCTAGGYHHASSRFIVFYMSTSAPCPKEEVEGKNLAESSGGISGTHQSHLRSNRINQAQLTAQLQWLPLNGPLKWGEGLQWEVGRATTQAMRQHFLLWGAH